MRLLLLCTVFLLLPAAARAQDAFEIQVYDAETAPPGTVGFEFHGNHFAVGNKQAEPPEVPSHGTTHLTLEPHIGIARWCEAGAYIQTAIRGDGTYDFAGIKLRFKSRIPRRLANDLIGLAVNFELSSVPQEYEAHRFAIELRPIFDLRWKRLYFAVNPMFGFALAGPNAGHPDFEPVAKFAVRLAPWIAIGPEYYGAIGPVDRIEPISKQAHRLFGALDFEHEWGRVKFDANIGVGYDFTGPDKWIVKAIIAFDFDPVAPKPAPGPPSSP